MLVPHTLLAGEPTLRDELVGLGIEILPLIRNQQWNFKNSTSEIGEEPTSVEYILRSPDSHIARNISASNVDTFRWRQTLDSAWNRGIESERLVDAAIEVWSILNISVVNISRLCDVRQELDAEIFESSLIFGKVEEQMCHGCRNCVTEFDQRAVGQ